MRRIADLEVTPDRAFATRLEERLLAEMSWEIGRKPAARKRHPRRRVVVATVIVLAAALVALVALVRRQPDERPPAHTVATTNPTTVAPTAAPSTSAAPTTSAPTTTSPGRPPFGDLTPGTYVVDNFVVPYSFTTTDAFERGQSTLHVLTLAGPDSLVIGVTEDVFQGANAAAAAANVCPDKTAFGEPTDTELLGRPATRVEGDVTDSCFITFCTSLNVPLCRTSAAPGDRLQVTATNVGDRTVVVVATAPADAWPSASTVVDEFIASMRPLT